MRIIIFTILSIISFAMLIGCAGNQTSKIDNKDTLTLGTVQKDIKIGTSQSDVVLILGPPNIVTSDADVEVWVYDKISTEKSGGEVRGSLLFISGNKASSSTTQKTLTVIIKFDNMKKVKNIEYHSSKY